MENVITYKKGNYILVLSLKNHESQFIPRFGNVQFSPGIYLYCGSAHGQGGLRSRVTRHLKKNSIPHWHIDWVKGHMKMLEIWGQVSEDYNECGFSNFISHLENASAAVIGFGSSDCKKKCLTHFWKLPVKDDIENIFNRLAKQYKGITRIFP